MAGASVDVQLKGVRKVLSQLQRWRKETRAQVGKAVEITALNVERGAKRNAPVDTGRLRSSIRIERPAPLTRRVGSGVTYAPHVEYGTRHMPAQPYLGPAWEAEKESYIRRVKAALRGDSTT